jgi:hypothetical protein
MGALFFWGGGARRIWLENWDIINRIELQRKYIGKRSQRDNFGTRCPSVTFLDLQDVSYAIVMFEANYLRIESKSYL